MQNNIALRNFLTVGYILSGTICLFGAKLQNIQWVNEGEIHKHFFHPYMQSFMMFIGEASCLLIFYIMKRNNPQQYLEQEKQALSNGREPLPLQKLVFPAISDLLATCLQYVALNFIPSSIYQMFKAWGIISTLIFVRILIGTRPQKSQMIGAGLVIVGIIVVQLSTLIFNQSSTFTNKELLFGCTLMLTSMILKGFQFAYQGKLILKYYTPPLKMIGVQGVYGSVFSWTVSVVAMFIPCTFGPKGCSYNSTGVPYLERPQKFYQQVIKSPILISMSVITMSSIALFNLFGLYITKYVNALARSVLNLTQIALVWVIGLIVTVTAGKHSKDYEWELISSGAIVMQTIGFSLLVLGTLVYNGNVISKLCEPQIVQQLPEEAEP